MELIESKAGKVVIITPLEKRLDASAAADFKQKMLAITSRGEQHILVDLSKVDFIDSSGLGAFISVLKKLGDTGTLGICQAKETVASVFKLTRIDRVLPLFQDQKEGVASLQG